MHLQDYIIEDLQGLPAQDPAEGRIGDCIGPSWISPICMGSSCMGFGRVCMRVLVLSRFEAHNTRNTTQAAMFAYAEGPRCSSM